MKIINYLFCYLLDLVSSQLINVDNHNCNVNNGYTWCSTLNKCVNENYEPCLSITRECIHCLADHFGDNTFCGTGCSINLIENLENDGFLGTDSNGCLIGPGIFWCDVLGVCISSDDQCPIESSGECIDIMCPNFCENGYKRDVNGCQLCRCDVINSDICPLEEHVCNNRYVCPIVNEITHCSMGGIPGYTTYELSLQVMDDDIYNIYALFGDSTDRMLYGTNMIIPGAYQEENIFNSNFGGIPEEIITINPSLRYDSWITIGLVDGDPQHKISSIGIDISEWNEETDLIIHNGAIFLLDPTERVVVGRNRDYIIAQLTIRNDLIENALFNVQGQMNNGLIWVQRGVPFNLKSPNRINGH